MDVSLTTLGIRLNGRIVIAAARDGGLLGVGPFEIDTDAGGAGRGKRGPPVSGSPNRSPSCKASLPRAEFCGRRTVGTTLPPRPDPIARLPAPEAADLALRPRCAAVRLAHLDPGGLGAHTDASSDQHEGPTRISYLWVWAKA